MILNEHDYMVIQKDICVANDHISPRLYDEYGVNLGLRDENGNGVLTGLTKILKIVSSKVIDGKKTDCVGELWYRGSRIEDIISSLGESEFGFEKTAYLLLMGQMPDESELSDFSEIIGRFRTLPTNFIRDVIMKAPTEDIMNSMTKSILTLAS